MFIQCLPLSLNNEWKQVAKKNTSVQIDDLQYDHCYFQETSRKYNERTYEKENNFIRYQKRQPKRKDIWYLPWKINRNSWEVVAQHIYTSNCINNYEQDNV